MPVRIELTGQQSGSSTLPGARAHVADRDPLPADARRGTSKGAFFNAADLPPDRETRDRVLLAVMGSPDKRQIDGLGGAHPLTTKVAIVARSERPGVDLEFLFAQLQPEKDTVDTTPNCGNMLAAVVPFALETGLFAPQGDTTTLRVLTLNTDMRCDITVCTPGSQVSYQGDTRIDGAPGTSAPITINFLDTAGSVCSGLLPTGRVKDVIDGLEVTCIDNGMPLVIVKATDLGRTGYESVAELNADTELKARLERLRIACGHAMGLGRRHAQELSQDDPGRRTARRRQPRDPQLHPACLPRRHRRAGRRDGRHRPACSKGPCATAWRVMPPGDAKRVSVEHPTGEFSVELALDPANPQNVTRAALLRTARLLLRGQAMVPARVWSGR